MKVEVEVKENPQVLQILQRAGDYDLLLYADDPPPAIGDYEDIRVWQKRYDEWSRRKPGSCPNFAGHF